MIEEIYDIKFEISNEEIRYEILFFDLIKDTYEYIYFDHQVYRRYVYTNDQKFHFSYINLTEESYIDYELKDGKETVKFYDPETNLLYHFIEDTSITVSYYDQMELVASLYHDSDQYRYRISFYYMDGWDTLHYYPFTPTTYSHLFNGATEVYTDYQIRVLMQGLRYYSIDSTVTLANNEINQYTFPETFTGTITDDALFHALETLEGWEHPLNITGLNPKDVLNQCVKIYNELTKKYID